MTEIPEVLAAQVLFWILLPVVLFGSLRWAVLAWLVMANLDGTGPGQSAASVVGGINTVKGVVLPLYLWYRMRDVPSELSASVPARLWVAVTAYAAVAAIWAPFPVAAAKLVGNMFGILLALIVLERAARKGLLDSRNLTVLMASSLTLAAVQTYYFGGSSYGFDGTDQPSRLSSFIAAQQFGAFLVAFLAIALWMNGFRPATRIALCGTMGVALVLNGSRAWSFGAVLVVAVYLWLSFRRTLAFIAFGAATAVLFVAFIVNLNSLDGFVVEDTSNRILATANALYTGVDTSHNVGLRDLSFRSVIYEGVIDELRGSSARELAFGHGTSSGGNAVLRVFPSRYKAEQFDPNRVIHNEWLRALYEWGFVGLGLLAAVGVAFLRLLIHRYRHDSSKASVSAVLSFLPAFLVALSSENVLAGAGNAVMVSLALIVALLWIPTIRAQRTAERRLAYA
jgi:hypothetical protein